jgi:membrane fusion protein (multidrug efflux system)
MANQTALYEEEEQKTAHTPTTPMISSPDEPPAPPPQKPAWKRPKFIIGLGAAIIIAAAIAIGAWLHFRNRVSTDDAQIDGHIVPVSSKIYGTVAEVLVNDNQPVKAGQVLLRIDARDYQAKVDQAKAALAYAEAQERGAGVGVPLTRETTASGTSQAAAQLSAARAEVARAQADYESANTAGIQTARANVGSAQAQYEKAQADLNRMRPLVAKEEISKQQFDSFTAAERVAESQLRAAQQGLVAAERDAETKHAAVLSAQAGVQQAQAGLESAQANQGQVKIQAAQVSSAAASVQQAKANLAAAELQLSYTTITAPMDGVVTKKSAEVGQIVQQGQGLMTVVPLRNVWVTANYKENQLANVRVGQKAEIEADVNGRSYQGHVDSIAGATGARMSLLPPENATGNFVKVVQRVPVKLVFDNLPKDALLVPGMSVQATILTE